METETPPAAAPQPAGGASAPKAAFLRRFVALLLDGVIVGIVYYILFVLLGTTGSYLGFLVWVAYLSYFEGGPTGQTLGKKALGIRVVDTSSGGAIGFGRGVIRSLARILSGIPLYLGYLWALWDGESQTWHDKIASTYVVSVK